MHLLDSHVHFWNYERTNPDFDWIGEGMENIQQTFLPNDWLKAITSKTNDQLQTTNYELIAVQAAETWQETKFLLDLASTYPFIKGVVGWATLDLFSKPNTWKHPKLKGFRHIIQAKPYGFMLTDEFQYFINKLQSHQLTYDLLLKPHQLHEALELVSLFPNQKFVIDHAAKPDVKHEDIDQWRSEIANFKHYSNVYCKVSGLVTEAHWQLWEPPHFDKIFDVIYQTFGSQRVMYGSDWPVCLLAAPYNNVLSLGQRFAQRLPESEQEAFFSGNATRLYGI